MQPSGVSWMETEMVEKTAVKASMRKITPLDEVPEDDEKVAELKKPSVFFRRSRGDPPEKYEESGLPIDVFLKLFRIDRDSLQPSVLEKIRDIIARLPTRKYEPTETIVRQGDAKAKNELLVFVHGDVLVWSHIFKTSSAESLTADSALAAPPPFSRTSRSSLGSLDDYTPLVNKDMVLTLHSPFYIGEERVLRGSWPTATYRASDDSSCTCHVLTERDIAALMLTGGFDLERTLRLRAFERTLAKHGMHVSVLRDAVFVDHFMAYLVKLYAAENLRFMVDLMKFKRDVDPGTDFEIAFERFEAIWDAYVRPWGAMSNVCAIEVPLALVEQITKARADAVAEAFPPSQSAEVLLSVFDPAAKRVKKFLETEMLPDFVRSASYPAFLKERFPLLERDRAFSTVGNRGVGTKVLKPPGASPPTTRQRGIGSGSSLPDRGSSDSVDVARHHHHHPKALHPAIQQQHAEFRNNNNGACKSPVLSARPSLQLKLANMADELSEIERNASVQSNAIRRKSSGKDLKDRRTSGGPRRPTVASATDALAKFAMTHSNDSDKSDHRCVVS